MRWPSNGAIYHAIVEQDNALQNAPQRKSDGDRAKTIANYHQAMKGVKMNKLDERGLLTKEAWEKIITELPEGNTCRQCRVATTTAQRDALLQLFESWIDEADGLNHLVGKLKELRKEPLVTGA